MKEILSGDIGRGLRIIDGHGCAPSDDPCVIAQMIKKHPCAFEEDTWPTLPAAWLLNSEIDLPFLSDVALKTDPKTACGPRGLRPDHIKCLFNGVFSNPEAITAKDRFTEFGKLYLSRKLPPWLRTLLGGGLLTPLNKVEPVPSRSPDARPVKAEDLDTSLFCKALARDLTPAVKEVVIPQQLGVGVRGGVELVAVGLKIEYTNAVAKNVVEVFAQEDVENAHNEYDRD